MNYLNPFNIIKLIKKPNGGYSVAINWQPTVLLCTLILATGWTLTAGGLYLHFKHRKNFEDVQFWNMLRLPFRIAKHRIEMGEYQIAKGLEIIENDRFWDGFFMLRLGVIRAPSNAQGRIKLASVFVNLFERPDLAIKVFEDGLKNGIQEPKFIECLISNYRNLQLDDKLLEHLHELNKCPLEPQTRSLVQYTIAQSLFLKGETEKAKAFIMKSNLEMNAQTTALLARIEQKEGNLDSAITRLEDYTTTHGYEPNILGILSYAYFEACKIELARKYAVARNSYFPEILATHIDLAAILDKTNAIGRKKRTLKHAIEIFSRNELALAQIGNLAVMMNDPQLAKETYHIALVNNFDAAPFALNYLNTLFSNKKYKELINECKSFSQEHVEFIKNHALAFIGIQTASHLALNDTHSCDVLFEVCLESIDPLCTHVHSISSLLASIGGKEYARKLLSAASKKDIKNDVILEKLIDLELDLDELQNLYEHIKTYKNARNPSNALLSKAYNKVAKDDYLFLPSRQKMLDTLIAPTLP